MWPGKVAGRAGPWPQAASPGEQMRGLQFGKVPRLLPSPAEPHKWWAMSRWVRVPPPSAPGIAAACLYSILHIVTLTVQGLI